MINKKCKYITGFWNNKWNYLYSRLKNLLKSASRIQINLKNNKICYI